METKKHYQHPSFIVVKLAGRDSFMGDHSEPVAVRGHRNDIDWEEE